MPNRCTYLIAAALLACQAPRPQTAVSASEPDVGQQFTAQGYPGTFAENPIVYFVVTDRFHNGNPANDNAYGRQKDGAQEIGTFHGGDLAGLTQKLQEGYFTALGINGIWITAPYEQIHGWVVGGDKEFKHYAYHGYYALDYTVLDENMGTADELRQFIDTAHAQGIRVIFDIVMNHPGYADLQTLTEYGVDVVWKGWENATLDDYHSYIDYNNFQFTNWWGPNWVRSGLPGYQEGRGIDERTQQLAFLPDFKTESDVAVEIPAFLRNKTNTRARTIADYTVRQYLIKWLTDWVRTYGVDGFRCDTAKHVELAAWAALKAQAEAALQAWKAAHPEQAIDEARFWMTGEVFPHGVERSAYFDHGFDNLINFDFQEQLATLLADDLTGNWHRIDELYANYAAQITADPSFNVLSYISSHDTRLFDRTRLHPAGTSLLLVPGGVQIFYGDETARPPGPVPKTDPQQNTRSYMNWDDVDEEVLRHWRVLGQFRRRHVALANGAHRKLADSPYTFARVHPRDRIIAVIGASGAVDIPVGAVFATGDRVRDAVTGREAVVAAGAVSIEAGASGLVLLERLVAVN